VSADEIFEDHRSAPVAMTGGWYTRFGDPGRGRVE
jgi:hypothetical protein